MKVTEDMALDGVYINATMGLLAEGDERDQEDLESQVCGGQPCHVLASHILRRQPNDASRGLGECGGHRKQRRRLARMG